ncbi:TMEM165/GDT1 family protein [Salinibacter ruber]|uniref:TMEM165/GDT1 family protein n=1 Tax=Salinibacter ruber TaxID=146919 RepID=UPI002167EBFF|nr:TMEM165/GDT1 family protein [Salinibacter ruber]MCS3642965.1 putative Ca2+/H+ antiporter (TMEM165/GDT1 family) [Salinibacter ruber]
MTEWIEIMLIAAGAQLAVLPGEKVQFIIAGLSTRFSPYLIVAAAGSAFAGWTILEVTFGAVLRDALPQLYLDLLTAGLFLLFAVLMYRSAPESGTTSPASEADDEGWIGAGTVEVLGVELPSSLATFLGIFSMMAFGEVGDKTQLVTISLAVQYEAASAIWLGEMLASLPVSLANALFFHHFAHRVNFRKAHFVGTGIFLFFALDMLLSVTTGHSIWGTAVHTVSNVVATGGGVP